MPVSPQLGSDAITACRVLLAGTALTDDAQIVSIEVQRAVGRVPGARVVLADGDMPAGDWPLADSGTCLPGTEVEIQAGYGDALTTLFKGVIVRMGVSIGADNASQLTLDCRDKAVAMTLTRRSAVYTDQTDSAVLQTLIGRAGLTAAVDSTAFSHQELLQFDCSDWDFLLARAEANGLLVIAEDGTLDAKAPALDGEAALKVTWGEDLQAFDAQLDALAQPATVKAEPMAAALARVRGTVRFQGSALAKVGGLLEVAGVGRHVAGKLLIGRLEHRIAEGGWTTEVGFGLDPQWHRARAGVIAPPPGAHLPGVVGLQVGVVLELAGDPAGEQRIRIQLPALDAVTDTLWARLLQPYASGGFGFFVLPEPGDEVLVGFFDQDPGRPVVLGSVYSSRHKPPYDIAAANDTKALVTRAGHRFEFDEQDKVITLTTPGANRIVLDDHDRSIRLEDQHGNQVRLDASGIRLDSPKDIVLNAKGEISITAAGNVSLASSGGDLKGSALNIACEAQIGFTGKGGATAELSAAGQTTVKGAIVMIN